MPQPRYRDALGHALSDKRIDILRAIGRTGSISQAARDAAVSYKAAWQAIDTLSNLAGVALVERVVGGAGGGGARLTGQGVELLALADELELARQQVHARRAGAGGSSGTTPAFAGLAGLALRTSMRNQLPARVLSLEGTGHIVRVMLALGDGRIAARITQESVQLLGLAPEMAVIVLCKATAVRVHRAAVPEAAQVATGANALPGVVARVARGDGGDEVNVTLAPGLQLVGFADAGGALRVRQRVTATVDESAVVVALAA